ncbi:MAG: hypothetical protein A2X23_05285 [Chloroflexi bacterium GWC2_73_18]|nr:MAG: hypothetical protein A2X23_05285 [Chloroflexi bacterium GWC2_73_18]
MPPERRSGTDRRSSLDRRAAPATTDHAAIRRISEELLPALMARLTASSLGELEVRQGGWRVRLRKPVQEAVEEARAAERTSQRPAVGGDGAHAPLRAVGPGPAGAPPRPAEARRAVATSPAVGFFAPDEATGVGTPIRAGDTLGHVEVLGVRQEVVAPVDGVVGRYLVEAGQAVEYGQELIRIELAAPAGSGVAPAASGAG